MQLRESAHRAFAGPAVGESRKPLDRIEPFPARAGLPDNAGMTPRSLARAAAVVLLLGSGAPALSAAPRRTRTPTRTPTLRVPTPASAVTPEPSPKPATLVPDPAWVGTPAAGERPHEAILRAKKAGATDDELVTRIAKENVRYSLSTSEIQQLRAAGVSARVIEAMLHSGRAPLPTMTGSPQRTPRATSPPTPPAVRKPEKH